MRREKLQFDRKVGGAQDNSWVTLSDAEEQSYELAVRTDIENEDENYRNWITSRVDDIKYTENQLNSINGSDSDGERIRYPGTSKEDIANFNLSNEVHGGLLGEIQAAVVYEDAKDHLTEDVSLYEFVEWYQQETTGLKQSILEVGPELAFAVPASGIEENGLRPYLNQIEFSGDEELKLSQTDGVVDQSSDNEPRSLLRQSGLESVNGILTENPEEVRRIVGEK